MKKIFLNGLARTFFGGDVEMSESVSAFPGKNVPGSDGRQVYKTDTSTADMSAFL